MGELWVFGYGSLMWRPGFPVAAAAPGLLKGAHRSLCVISIFHRGTHEQPGLVLGLDRGGACRGTVYRVAPGAEEETVAYLREREQVTDVYVEAYRPVRVLDGSGITVKALTYLVDRNHEQYAGVLSLEEQFRMVSGGKGQSGENAEYVLNTVQHLEEAGVHDALLAALAARLRATVPGARWGRAYRIRGARR
jgi:glutathione-specific gamma-glutamylcyclotransferase